MTLAESIDSLRVALDQVEKTDCVAQINEASLDICECFHDGGKLLILGNGGSSAEASHFAAELVGRFEKSRRQPLPAINIMADHATVTALTNDYSYTSGSMRAVEAFGRKGDVLFVISTSGSSGNVCAALQAAKQKGIQSIALIGGSGGDIESRKLADLTIVAPSEKTRTIQEIHLLVIHHICNQIDIFFS